jgi:arylsulfatase A-like enzyme
VGQTLVISRRVLAMLALVVTACLVQQGAASAQERKRPNILLILVDDLGYGDLSSYGARDLRTPHIDRLIRQGMRLDNFYANCPVCSPTRAAVLSGRYPEMVGVPGVIRTHPQNSWGHLSPDAVLLPSLLKPAKYHSAIIGKWHLGLEPPNRPNDRGFDLFHGYLGDMMDDYYKHRRHGINYMRRDGTEIDPKGHATDLFTEWTREYLRGRAKTDDGSRFFLYLAYNAPHTPIQPPAEWLEKVRQREKGIDGKRAKLVALVEHLDDGIGKVLDTLEETGLADDTLVIFTSDNGGQLNAGANNGNLRDGKQSVYEGGIKVPFCAVWPGSITPGSRSSRIGMTMDIAPTLIELLSLRTSVPFDGTSLLPTLLGKPQPETKRDLFFCRREGGTRYGGKTIEAIRRGDWKLLQNSPWAPLELYNLRDDPLERVDRSSERPKIFRELSAALRGQIQRYGTVPWQKPEK